MRATKITFADGTVQDTAAKTSVPSGTKTNFFQAAAPTGWTQCTSYNDYAIRIVSGTGGASGGTVNFTTAFVSQSVTGTNTGGAISATTLSTSQMPSHNHTFTSYFGGCPPGCYSGSGAQNQGRPAYVTTTSSTGGGTSHTHTFTQPTFTGTAIDLAVKYINNIIAIKS